MASKKSGKNEGMAVPCGPDDAWRAREDAQALRRAGEIMADKARFGAAKRVVISDTKAVSKLLGGSKSASKAPSASIGFAKGRK